MISGTFKNLMFYSKHIIQKIITMMRINKVNNAILNFNYLHEHTMEFTIPCLLLVGVS